MAGPRREGGRAQAGDLLRWAGLGAVAAAGPLVAGGEPALAGLPPVPAAGAAVALAAVVLAASATGLAGRLPWPAALGLTATAAAAWAALLASGGPDPGHRVVGALAVVPVALAVRSLCGSPAARALLPLLAVLPSAAWPDADAARAGLLAATGLAAGVVGSEHRWRGWQQSGWAALAGALVGLAAGVDLAAAGLGVGLLAAYFQRRRPLLCLVSGAAAALALAAVAGTAPPAPPARVAAPLLLLLAGGPALARGLRRLRTTPAWPFVLGGAAAVAVGVAAGDGPAGSASWSPAVPWLLAAAVAPAARPRPGSDDPHTGPAPLLLAAVGAAVAVALGPPG